MYAAVGCMAECAQQACLICRCCMLTVEAGALAQCQQAEAVGGGAGKHGAPDSGVHCRIAGDGGLRFVRTG